MLPVYEENRLISGEYDKNLAAVCDNGIFVGQKKDGILSFKGIPFAKAPVGALRWKAPQKCEISAAVREAYHFGPSPIQTVIPSERASMYEQSEDCLYLNIWKYTGEKSLAEAAQESAFVPDTPTMVFIHGGSYGWGGTSDPLYDGQNFVKAHPETVLITIAYRTGIMGFLNFEKVKGGKEYEDACNLGLLDQIAALEWVQRNIRAFGGHSENVTVFGESAGGGSVSILPVLERTEGLFRRVIAESGAVNLSFSRKESYQLTEMLMKESGAGNMQDLLAMTEDELKTVNQKLNEFNNFPIRDGRIVPEDLYGAYEKGAGSNVDMMIGTNADEVRYWINEVGGEGRYRLSIPVLFENYLKKMSPKDRQTAREFISGQKGMPSWRITEFMNEVSFRGPSIRQAELHYLAAKQHRERTGKGGSTYMYYWTYPSALPNMGACHAVELAYVFNNLEEKIYTGDNINAGLAAAVQEMWVSYARNGDPSVPGHAWAEYEPEGTDPSRKPVAAPRRTMMLGSRIGIVSDPIQEERVLTAPLLKYNINGTYTKLDFNVPFVWALAVLACAVLAVVAALLIFIF